MVYCNQNAQCKVMSGYIVYVYDNNAHNLLCSFYLLAADAEV